MGWLEDLGNAACSVVSTVGDAAEGLVDTVTEAAEEVVDAVVDTAQDGVDAVTSWVAANGGPILGGIANVVGGVINGVLEGIQDITKDVLHIVGDVGGIVGSILRLDLPGLIAKLGDLGIDLADLVLDGLRYVTGGYVVGAIVDNFERENLRAFVEGLINSSFSGARRDDILRRLNIRGGDWGLPFNAHSRVFMLDSANSDLRTMHQNGTLDLFAIAGLLSFNSFQINRPRFMLRKVDFTGAPSLLPPNRFDIAQFLDNTARVRFQLFALRPEALNDTLKVAVRKFRKLGVKLTWNDSFGIPTLGRMTSFEIQSSEYHLVVLPQVEQEIFFANRGIKPAAEPEEPVRSVAAFHYGLDSQGVEKLYGQVAGRGISEGSDSTPCATAGRTDSCCSLVNRGDEKQPLGSGVIYRDIYPPYFSRYVLAHEIGHYFGLCHFGHDGVQNIMFSTAGGSKIFDPGLLRYYLYSEPQFLPEDGKNAWRFIVNQMPSVL
jgi:hypothetical protein